MAPKIQPIRNGKCARVMCDFLHARLPQQGMVKLYKGSIFVITEAQFATQSRYVTTKMYRTPTCGCNNNAIFSDRAIFTFPTVAVCRPR